MSERESRLSVLLVVPWDQESGGVAEVVGSLAHHLEANGHRILFLHPGSSETMRSKTTKWGFPGVELKLRAPFNPDYPIRSVLSFVVMFPFTLLQLFMVLMKNRIQLINIHYPGDHFVYFAFCRWFLGCRLVLSIHGMDAMPWDAPDAPPSRAMRLLFRAASLVVAPSSRFLERCNGLLASLPARRLAIHNGTDVSELQTVTAAGPKEDFILSVCSLDEWKGVDVLIRAMATLRDRGETTRLLVAGDGPQRNDLERLITELGLQQQVTLLGQQSKASVARLLHECTLFVLPSRFETFGIAALEAMAAGKAVIGTKVDGILEIVNDGETGVVVDPDDIAGLAAAMSMLLHDATLRSRLSRAAQQHVKERFQRHQMGARYIHAFQETLTHGA